VPADAAAFLTVWHPIVSTRDLAGLSRVLSDDVAMGAPPYWQKLRGKPLVQKLLGVILDTIEDFTYHREWTSGRELALEFHGRVGDLALQGIDLITLDDDNRIANLDVMIRPMNALEELRDRVAPRMAGSA
jgi:hypothetical protein